MRWLVIGIACLAIAGCGPKIERADGPGESSTGAAGVAFTYNYTFRLPSAQIAAAQEARAAACEHLGGPRCRIAGMTYHVDEGGQIGASLTVSLAAPIARAFGRQGVAAVESDGGTLIGADIGGTDATPATRQAEADRAAATADQTQTKRELGHPNTPAEDRKALIDRQVAAVQQERAATAAADQARASVAFTPMTFAYQAGSGTGFLARLAEAAHTAATSISYTLWAVLTLLATLGPPALLLLVLFLFWRWIGRRWWRRLAGPSEAE